MIAAGDQGMHILSEDELLGEPTYLPRLPSEGG